MFSAVDSCPVPVIARVHGAALGGGTGLACCCDIVLAREDARFGFTEVRLGLVPATIGPFALARIGRSHARALFLTGELFDAAHARAIGIAHEVHADDRCARRCGRAHARAVLRGGPAGGARRQGADRRAARRRSRRRSRRTPPRRSPSGAPRTEGREGIAAFLERREPDW